jgi:hypothetical protein
MGYIESQNQAQLLLMDHESLIVPCGPTQKIGHSVVAHMCFSVAKSIIDWFVDMKHVGLETSTWN